MSRRFYRPELDVLRFAAFLFVFLFHIPFDPPYPAVLNVLRSMRCGLCLFFLLSAFLITELLVRERETTGTVHLKSFFIRRALRIWPLYFLALGISYFLGNFTHSWHTSRSALPFLLLMGTNFYIAHYGWDLAWITPLWSISVEEQFYLAIPSLAKAGGARVLGLAASVCMALSYGVLAWLGYRHAPLVNVVWVNSFMQFQFFAAGTLLALHFHKRSWTPSWVQRALLLIAGCALVALSEALFHLFRSAPATLPQVVAGYGMVLAGTVAFFLAFFAVPVRLPAWLIYLGRISYGLYVVHCFTIGFETTALHWLWKHGHFIPVPFTHLITLIVTILLAMLSFRFFERPILAYKERFAFVKSGASTRS